MALIGRLHPLLIHFPIALVLAAAAAEAVSTLSGSQRWRVIAIANLRASAFFAVIAAVAGWRLAFGLGMGPSPLLEWHRWLGTIAAALTLVAALAAPWRDRSWSLQWPVYRAGLITAAALVTVTGHLGGLLVWGADFLRP